MRSSPSADVPALLAPPDDLPPTENKLFYPALDGLRAVALFMVFSFHYGQLPSALNWGWAGVDLFFVLSGFLITGILYDSRLRSGRFRVFYVRRALRIFPLYYLVLVVAVLLYPIFHWQLHPGLWLWPTYLGNYAPFLWPHDWLPRGSVFEDLRPTLHAAPNAYYLLDHLWSLCVEEQFYLAWPILVFLVKDRTRLRNLCLAAVVGLPLVRLILLQTLSSHILDMGLLYQTAPLRADSLLLGGALALALRGPEVDFLRRHSKHIAFVTFSGVLVIEIVSLLTTGHLIDSTEKMAHSAFTYTVLGVLSASVILLAINEQAWLFRRLQNPWLRAVGQRSYGMYVYHQLLYSAYGIIALHLSFGHKRYLLQQRAIVALVLTTVLAWLSFRYFEAPFLRLKARLAP